MPFSELIAQDRALGSLRSALRRGALHHAYLFGGPEGVGKGRAARLLAQAANCEAGGAGPSGLRDDPCGTCGPCRKIERGLHPDVLLLQEERTMARAGRWEPKGGRAPSRDIVVDQVRDLVDHRLALKRHEGRRRFVVIDPADRMNPQAQNALLKTLEEPPEATTLVLVSSSPDTLLPTIRSRCLRVAFGPLPAEVVAERLARSFADRLARRRGKGAAAADGEAAAEALRHEDRLAVALAAGSIGRAEALAAGALQAQGEALAAAVGLGPDDARAWLAFAREHGEGREEAAELCELLALWLRDVLAAQAGGRSLALVDLAAETRRAAAALPPAEVLRRRAGVVETAAALRQNASPVLALEGLLIGWFHGRA